MSVIKDCPGWGWGVRLSGIVFMVCRVMWLTSTNGFNTGFDTHSLVTFRENLVKSFKQRNAMLLFSISEFHSHLYHNKCNIYFLSVTKLSNIMFFKSLKSLCSIQRHAWSWSDKHEWEDEKPVLVTRLSEWYGQISVTWKRSFVQAWPANWPSVCWAAAIIKRVSFERKISHALHFRFDLGCRETLPCAVS